MLLKKILKNPWVDLTIATIIGIVFVGFISAKADQNEPNLPDNATLKQNLPEIPMFIPEADPDGIIYFTTKDGIKRPTTLDAELQHSLTKYIKQKGSQIAAVVLADPANGNILAIAQGRSPKKWNSSTHSALYSGFPAASIFKNVSASAAIEIAELDEKKKIGLNGGCSNVNKRGVWLKDVMPTKRHGITLSRAYGRSCNGFFAKLAINYVGLGAIVKYAHNFGWGEGFSTDFALKPSPIKPPKASGSSIHTVGRFAAGFGLVGLSAVHAAWFNVAMANDGKTMPLKIFADTKTEFFSGDDRAFKTLYSPETGVTLREIMRRTTHGGTASSIFRKRRYRRIRDYVGGKTGTLTGSAPRGLTTWFAGMMPIQNPQVVVASVVLAHDRWMIKGPHLAAEALRLWHRKHKKVLKMTNAKKQNFTPRSNLLQ